MYSHCLGNGKVRGETPNPPLSVRKEQTARLLMYKGDGTSCCSLSLHLNFFFKLIYNLRLKKIDQNVALFYQLNLFDCWNRLYSRAIMGCAHGGVGNNVYIFPKQRCMSMKRSRRTLVGKINVNSFYVRSVGPGYYMKL